MLRGGYATRLALRRALDRGAGANAAARAGGSGNAASEGEARREWGRGPWGRRLRERLPAGTERGRADGAGTKGWLIWRVRARWVGSGGLMDAPRWALGWWWLCLWGARSLPGRGRLHPCPNVEWKGFGVWWDIM